MVVAARALQGRRTTRAHTVRPATPCGASRTAGAHQGTRRRGGCAQRPRIPAGAAPRHAQG
eukprot:9965437-Lingulodinium_polyedra.AAC.1